MCVCVSRSSTDAAAWTWWNASPTTWSSSTRWNAPTWQHAASSGRHASASWQHAKPWTPAPTWGTNGRTSDTWHEGAATATPRVLGTWRRLTLNTRRVLCMCVVARHYEELFHGVKLTSSLTDLSRQYGVSSLVRSRTELELGIGLVVGLGIAMNCIIAYGGPWLL